MEYLDKINEQRLEILSNYELVKSLFPLKENIKDFYYAYAVYLDDSERSMILGWLGNDPRMLESEYSFKKGLKWFIDSHDAHTVFIQSSPVKFRAYGLWGLMSYISIYQACFIQGKNIKDIYQNDVYRHNCRTNAVVDEFLMDSRSFLLWNYQLENLLGLFYSDPKKRMEMRKGINAKKRYCWEETRALGIESKLDSSLTLYDILKERMVFGYTSLPPFKGAFTLLNLLNYYDYGILM